MTADLTITAAIEIARTAMETAKAAEQNWADAVDEALNDAGYDTLYATHYGAAHDPRLVAVVEFDGKPVGIWGNDDGTWTSGPARIHWRNITIYGAGSGERGYDVGQEITSDEDRIAFLAEYRDRGSIAGAFLADPADCDQDDPAALDALCSAGPSVDEIDWSGFEA